MYGLIKADNPKEATQKMIHQAAFKEMDKAGIQMLMQK
jgi:hypothetical protein